MLKGVSLKPHRGDVSSIIGSSGSGKSTFLRCINFLEKPSAGTITVKGELLKTQHDPKKNELMAQDIDQLRRMRTSLAACRT